MWFPALIVLQLLIVTRFVFRTFGLEKLREHLRKGISLGEEFTSFLQQKDDLFEIVDGPRLGVVAFRINPSLFDSNSSSQHQWSNDATRQICRDLNASGDIFITGCEVDGRYVIRMVTTYVSSSSKSICQIFSSIVQIAERSLVLSNHERKTMELRRQAVACFS